MEGFHPDWQGYLKPLIALVAPKNIQEHLSRSIHSFRPKSYFPSDKYLELKCLTYSELMNPTPTPSTTSPSRTLLKSPYSTSNPSCVILGNRTGNYLGGIDILNINWMSKVRYETPALYILCFDWQSYPIGASEATDKSQETVNELESEALGIIKSVTSILKKRHSPPSVLIFVILPSGTPDPQACVACFRRNHFPELQAIFVTCGLKHQKHLNVRIERLAEMAYETAQAYYSENERRWRKSAIKAQTAGITVQNDSFIGSLSMKTSSSGVRYSVSNSMQSGLSPRFGRNSYFSISNSSSNSTNNLLKNASLGGASSLSRPNKNNSFASSNSSSGYQTLGQLQSKVLLIRYCIKSAVMNEFCGNFALAIKQYIAAWENIMNETSIPSYQFVILCNIISLRLYHIYVVNGEIQKAMNHLKIHCRNLREFGLNHPKFAFLASLWLSQTLQKLAAVLFFHLVNKSNVNSPQEQGQREDWGPCPGQNHQYPDWLEASAIPLSIGSGSLGRMIPTRTREGCSEDCSLRPESDNLGSILSSIARAIQKIVIISNSSSSTQQPEVGAEGCDPTEKSCPGDEESHGGIAIIGSSGQNNTVVDILLNISKLYKTSAEYSCLSKSQLSALSAEFDAEFFHGDQKLGGEILSPLSLGCFEELSSPETFLEYERKGDPHQRLTLSELSKLSSLYIGSDSFDIDQIEDRSIASEVLASCEIVRRNIQTLLESRALFQRSISLYYISAVIYRHFYPTNFNSIPRINTNHEPIPQSKNHPHKHNSTDAAVHVDSASHGSAGSLVDGCSGAGVNNTGTRSVVGAAGGVGSGSYVGTRTDRFFQMISFSFAEYLFEENYINCSLSIFEAIFQSAIPKHVFAEISRLTTIDEQQSKLFGKRKANLWEIVNPQMTNTCFQLTSTYFDSSFWLFLNRISVRILECLSIQNLDLEERMSIPRPVLQGSGQESKLFASGPPRTASHASEDDDSAKQDDQYIYSVVSSFLAVLRPKKTWVQGQSQSQSASSKQRATTLSHCSILVLSYLIISNSMEKRSDPGCKQDIEGFHAWVQNLYRKIIVNGSPSVSGRDGGQQSAGGSQLETQGAEGPPAKGPVKNILFTQFLHNNYSTILQDQSSPDRIIIMVHHFPTFLNVFIDSRMEASLVSNIGILGVIIDKFEVVEFEDSGSFNSQLSLHCRIRHVNYIPQNYENNETRKLYYQEYRPPILIFGLFLYLLVSSPDTCPGQTSDYIKFGVNTLRYFNYQKSILNISECNVYNFSYVQFCLRSPPLSYFTCTGSWLRHARTLIYDTPSLQIVPGGFLDISKNTIANPVPIYKVPVDDLQLLSKFCHPFNSLPIFHKLVTNNMMFNDQLCLRVNNYGICSNTESIKKLCKVWLLSPFDAMDVVLSESKQRVDTIESMVYNAAPNEIRPLQLIIRIPRNFSEQFILDVSVNVARLVSQDSHIGTSDPDLEKQSDLTPQTEERVLSRLGVIQIPSTDRNWEIAFSENSISPTSCGSGTSMADHDGSSSSSSGGGNSLTPQSVTVGRFAIDGRLLRRGIYSDQDETQEAPGHFAQVHSLLDGGDSVGEVQFASFDSTLANPATFDIAAAPQSPSLACPFSSLKEGTFSFIDENITPYFKVLKSGSSIVPADVGTKNEDGKDKEEEDSIFHTLNNSTAVLLFVPVFLSISKSGKYNVSVNVKILNRYRFQHGDQDRGGGVQGESRSEPEKVSRFTSNLILHDLEQSRPWFVGECIMVNSRIPKMDTLHGCVNYLDRAGQALEHRVVPLFDNSKGDSQFFISFEITNQQLREKIVIEDFVLPTKFSTADDRYPKILDGNEMNTSLINISKEDLYKYYVSRKNRSQKCFDEMVANSSYHPKLIVSLEYKLSCEVSSFSQDCEFLQFVIFPFQIIFASNFVFNTDTEQKRNSISLKSFPIKYELFSSLYSSLISPSEKFYPITLETHVRQLSYIGIPFVYEAVITNHTNLPQPLRYSLVYPPNRQIPELESSPTLSTPAESSKTPISSTSISIPHTQTLPEWLPLLIQGVTSSSTLLAPNSTETISWTCIPTQSGTIPLPCIYIQSERSNKQFVDTRSRVNAPTHQTRRLSAQSQSQQISVLYTSEKRIVVIPRPPNCASPPN
ncbi:hypothetical protein OJ252_2466 [Cryptosporidium canis]|uniref:Trafficking protein particle complex subunit 11 domain-containing protein n=1 Tax=Cryptosporidium canis TaxID=195482 RepID=A0ABQ8P667_9CRYT|nr:hypothetical protein OJ252_2466 [Cryptosporidium canis]